MQNVQRFEIGPWVISYDAGATRRAYGAVPLGAAESCGCDACRNYRAAREIAYPSAVRALLERLGMDYRKAAEVYHEARLCSGLHEYGGWFHLVGSFERGGEVWESEMVYETIPGDGAFEIAFSPSLALVPSAFAGLPLIQLEFRTRAAWIVSLQEAQ